MSYLSWNAVGSRLGRIRTIVTPKLGPDLFQKFLNKGSNFEPFLDLVLGDPQSHFWTVESLPGGGRGLSLQRSPGIASCALLTYLKEWTPRPGGPANLKGPWVVTRAFLTGVEKIKGLLESPSASYEALGCPRASPGGPGIIRN